MSSLKITSFKSRLSLIFIGLLVLVLSSIYWLVNQQNLASAEKKILSDLDVTGHAFDELIYNRTQSLFDIVRPATKDYAFKRAYAVGDVPTLVSAMDNITQRIYHVTADTMLIIDKQGKPIASTRSALTQDIWLDVWQAFVAQAEQDEYLEASKMIVFDGQVYQFIISPLLLPDHEAWTVLGFLIDESFAQGVKRVTGRDLSVITLKPNKHIVASSHTPSRRQAVMRQLHNHTYSFGQTHLVSLPAAPEDHQPTERFVSLLKPLLSQRNYTSSRAAILLQGSYDDEVAHYEQLNRVLLGVFVVILFFSLLVVLALARSLSSPIEQLTRSVRAIRDGDYDVRADIQRTDEVGLLAESVNHMALGLGEKEQMRNLLGKVVSDDIANELLSKDVVLGGEEKKITVLFTDIRNFTSLCEGASPSEILGRLNRYFDVAADAIEHEGGVVDKYIGDAIMALFGAPVYHKDAPQRALRAAISMQEMLRELNRSFAQEGIPALTMGIGINTGKVVIGNMGSKNRLNYTAIGDAVNISSRLEGLTKLYGVPIIASEVTMHACPDFYCRYIDTVRVKGKRHPVRIYMPIALVSHISSAQKEIERLYTAAMKAYQQQNWQQALTGFSQLCQAATTLTAQADNLHYHSELLTLYVTRCQNYLIKPPPSDWDGIYTQVSK